MCFCSIGGRLYRFILGGGDGGGSEVGNPKEAITTLMGYTKVTEFGRVSKAKEGLKLAIGKVEGELLASVNGRQKGVLIEKGVVE